MADKKVTELTTLTTVSGDDLLMVVNDPLGAPASRKINVAQFLGAVSSNTVHTGLFQTSANSTIAGTTATISANLNVSGITTATGIMNLNGVTKTGGRVITNSLVTPNSAIVTNRSSETIVNNTLKANGTIVVTGNTTFSSNLHSTGNTTIENLTVVGNAIVLRDRFGDPTSSNAANEGVKAGTIFYSNTHIYIATDSNTLKRVAVSDFSI